MGLIRKVLSLFLVTSVVAIGAAPTAAAVSADEVKGAIDKAVGHLVSLQQEDGSWKRPDGAPGGAGYDVGRTALVTLALARSGSPTAARAVHGGLAFVTRHAPEPKTYTAGLVVTLLSEEDPGRYRKLIERYASMTVRAQARRGAEAGGWGYGIADATRGRPDNSNSQFAVMALHGTERAGLRIPKTSWKLVKKHYEVNQSPDGGWSYLGAACERARGQQPSGSTLSMTAACAVSLHLAEQALNPVKPEPGREAKVSPAVRAAIAWISRSRPQGPAYTWVTLQRLGLHTGRDQFGDTDWRQVGADSMVTLINRGPTDAADEALALLFLTRLQSPAVDAEPERAGD